MKENTLLGKWLNNELTPAELEIYKQTEDTVLNDAILENAAYFKTSSNSKMPSFEEFDTAHLEPTDISNSGKSWILWVSGIAAAIILAFGVSTLFDTSLVEVQTTLAENKSIQLPDNSEVILNANTKISYSDENWHYKRFVQLEGEALFDVVKESIFEVKTDKGVVAVLGTKFNVKQRGDTLEVTCYEGKVSITTNHSSEIITAGQKVSLLNGNLLRGITAQTNPSWNDNLSRFQKAPLEEVIAELEQQFSVHCDMSRVNDTILFTGAFEHDNLTNALKAITVPLRLNFKIKDDGEVLIYNEN